jgi:hypothetical protein
MRLGRELFGSISKKINTEVSSISRTNANSNNIPNTGVISYGATFGQLHMPCCYNATISIGKTYAVEKPPKHLSNPQKRKSRHACSVFTFSKLSPF